MTERLTLTALPVGKHVRFEIAYADGSSISVDLRPRHARALSDLLHKAALSSALKVQMA